MSTEDKVLDTATSNADLIEAVRKQIEYYFSKENLQSDVYLTSQMDAQMSVAISVVMKFAKLKALTQDEALVRKSLEGSSLSIVDNRIKANIKASGRSTIILREIPSDAAEEEVKEIFNYEGCKPINSIRSDIGDTWFVVMETEEDAKDTALDLRLKKRTFRGQPVKARIKTEPVVRSFYPVTTVPVPPVYPMNPMIPFAPMVPDLGMMQYGYVAPSADNTAVSTSSVENVENVDATTGGEDAEGKSFDEANGDGQFNKLAGRPKDGRRVPRTTTNPRDVDVRKRDRRTGERPGKDRVEKKVDAPVTKPPIEVNSMTFPPLLGSEDTPIPTPGYKDDFTKYNLDEIIAIVKNVKEAHLPTEVKAEEHPIALTTTPNLDLLKRQRTFSIDETREQLRQGKPVQREAIISGAVDYRSLMYGDDSHPAGNTPKDVSVEETATPSISVPSSSTAQTEISVPEPAKESAVMESSDRITSNPTNEIPPVSPTKISSSTWAAMVKSSAAATQAEVTQTAAPTTNNIPRSATKPKPSNNNAKTAEKPAEPTQTPVKGKKSNDNKGEKSHEKKSAQKPNKDDKKKEKKPSDETQENAAAEDMKTIETATEKLSVNDATTDSTSTPGWGGKASFANVLKQKLTEDGASTTEENKVSADNNKGASNDKNKNKNKSNPDQRLKNNNSSNNNNNNTNSFRTAARNNNNNNNKNERETKRPSDGMWVKETLPALPTEK